MGGKPAVEAGGGRGRPPHLPRSMPGSVVRAPPPGTQRCRERRREGTTAPSALGGGWGEIGAAEGTPAGTEAPSERGYRDGSSLRNSEGRSLCAAAGAGGAGGRGGAAGPAGGWAQGRCGCRREVRGREVNGAWVREKHGWVPAVRGGWAGRCLDASGGEKEYKERSTWEHRWIDGRGEMCWRRSGGADERRGLCRRQSRPEAENGYDGGNGPGKEAMVLVQREPRKASPTSLRLWFPVSHLLPRLGSIKPVALDGLDTVLLLKNYSATFLFFPPKFLS